AFALIDMLQKPFAPEDYKDNYREALLEVIRAKLAGTELPEIEAKPATEEVDLVAALQASVEALKRSQSASSDAKPKASDDEEPVEKPKARRSRAKASA